METKNNSDIQKLGQVLSMSFRLISNRISSKFKSCGYDITPEQYTILTYLYEHGELQQNQISKLTNKDEPSVSRIINNMIKNDIVKKVQHPNDRRTNLICLTEKSKQIRQALYNESSILLEEALKDIAESDIENFYGVLNRIINNLNRV
ncbi:winged helix-turn-helix transcriptional regulator [Clostridium sp. P21]|uniref:Winged helix-turn-helix transcriptional regulator n=1 Tax=Clostridium muellerianum TaxID=2716538 RepID=A0A7Y0HP65_9CLOT|nr:MarR family winged helix-turn-helix transcriptional regulator [Clostridium muellerianum]NMM63900.1 winged helix-turn-helix transcriptional regulator [Clostridium muellerianum]